MKIVPPLPVTEGQKLNLPNGVHGKCRIIFYYLKWVAKIYFNTLIDENNWYMTRRFTEAGSKHLNIVSFTQEHRNTQTD